MSELSSDRLEQLAAARQRAGEIREKMKTMTDDEKIAHKEEKKQKAREYAREQYAKKKAALASLEELPTSNVSSVPTQPTPKPTPAAPKSIDSPPATDPPPNRQDVVPPPEPEEEPREEPVVAPTPAPPTKAKPKKRKQPIVIMEHSDSESDSDEQPNVVYVKRRGKKKESPPPPPPKSEPRQPLTYQQKFSAPDLPSASQSMSSLYGNVF